MSPLLKLLLEVGPLVVFFAAFQWFKNTPLVIGDTAYEGAVAATFFFMPAILASLAVSWRMTHTLPRMAVVTAIVVIIFGGMSIWLNDDLFVKMKPTIINALFAIGLGVGLLQGRSYLRYLMEQTIPLTDRGWTVFTQRWMLFFAFMAVLNEVIWRTQTTDFWVSFRTFGNLPITIVFVAAQFPLLKREALDSSEER